MIMSKIVYCDRCGRSGTVAKGYVLPENWHCRDLNNRCTALCPFCNALLTSTIDRILDGLSVNIPELEHKPIKEGQD